MYFDPYVLGFVMGVLSTLAMELLVIIIGGVISVNRRKKK